jgi:hypothetical protein
MKDMHDMLLGAIIVGVFLAFAIGIGFVVSNFKKAKFARLFAPLIPVINGRFDTNDSVSVGGIEGQYEGKPVIARAIPEVATSSGSGVRYNVFEVELGAVEGGHDWKLSYGIAKVTKIFGPQSWYFSADSDEVTGRLEASRILAEVEGLAGFNPEADMPTLQYRARGKKLTLRGNISPQVVLSPEQLEGCLKGVQRLAGINESVNPGEAARQATRF